LQNIISKKLSRFENLNLNLNITITEYNIDKLSRFENLNLNLNITITEYNIEKTIEIRKLKHGGSRTQNLLEWEKSNKHDSKRTIYNNNNCYYLDESLTIRQTQ